MQEIEKLIEAERNLLAQVDLLRSIDLGDARERAAYAALDRAIVHLIEMSRRYALSEVSNVGL